MSAYATPWSTLVEGDEQQDLHCAMSTWELCTKTQLKQKSFSILGMISLLWTPVCWSTLQLKCSMAMLQWCNRVYYMLTSSLFYLGSISVDDDRIEPWTFILESSTPVNRATAIAQTLQNLLRKLFLNIFSAGVFLTIKEAFFVVSRVELGKKKRKKFFTTSRGKKLAGTMDLDIATYFSNLKMFLLRPTYIGR